MLALCVSSTSSKASAATAIVSTRHALRETLVLQSHPCDLCQGTSRAWTVRPPFANRAINSGCDAGNTFLFATDAGCQYSSRPCVPLANRWSTARFGTSITRIMWARFATGAVSDAACQSPAKCKFQRACVLTRRRINCTLLSWYHCWPLAPRARHLPLILSEWLCAFAMRRTTVRFHLSL